MTTIKEENFNTFINNLEFAQEHDEQVKKATTPWYDVQHQEGNRYYLGSTDQAYNIMGYVVSASGELTSLYSMIPEQGNLLIQDAIKNGADNLDCFDGYLTSFYHKHGFIETRREKNWVQGEPDVVYMALIQA